MKSRFLFIIIGCLLSLNLWSQDTPTTTDSETTEAKEITDETQVQKSTPWTSRNAIGLRIGAQSGVSYQHKFKNQTRLEANLHFGNPLGRYFRDMFDGPSYDWDNEDWSDHSRVRWMIPSVSVAYQWTYPIGPYRGWRWYVGPGAGIGAYAGELGAELFGQIGFEYIFKRIPLQLAFDYKLQAISKFSHDRTYFSMGFSAFAVSVRFVF